jgi:light-regulated signal transduction histidine kinase (bacteriophytochrome)
VRYDPFYEDDGSVSGVVVHTRDTTERKQIEDQLRRTITELEVANQELKAFSDALAHDLRSPLLIVTNFSHQLREALAASLDKEHLEDLERISSAGMHMTHIIDDLRDLADVNRSEISR